MKKFLLLMLVVWTGIASSCKYDDDELWGSVDDLANRISAMETLTQQMNGDIAAMQAIVTAVENQVAVSEVEKLTDGYILHFTNGQTATIKNGTDGKDGKDAPAVGLDKEGGVYYWTLTVDGKTEWLTDEAGNKIAVANDPGAAGSAGRTPSLKVDKDGYWMVSYDGTNFDYIEDVNGHKVNALGTNGVAQFKEPKVSEDEESITIVMADDTEYVLPLLKALTFYDANKKEVDIKNIVWDGSNSIFEFTYELNLEGASYEIYNERGVSVKISMADNKATLDLGSNQSVSDVRAVVLFYNESQTLTAVFKIKTAPWDGKKASKQLVSLEEGNGGQVTTFGITTAADLKRFAYMINGNEPISQGRAVTRADNSYEGVTFKLVNDIDLSNYPWEPIGLTSESAFKGTFDGNGKTISGLKVVEIPADETGITTGAGLFGVIENATVKNVTIKDAKVELTNEVEAAGLVVGRAYGNVTFEGVKVVKEMPEEGTTGVQGAQNVGSIAGIISGNSVTIKDCEVTDASLVTSPDQTTSVGGVVGSIDLTGSNPTLKIQSCTVGGVDLSASVAEGETQEQSSVGGIVGSLTGVTGTLIVEGNTVSDAIVVVPEGVDSEEIAIGSVVGNTDSEEVKENINNSNTSADDLIVEDNNAKPDFEEKKDGSYRINTLAGWNTFVDMINDGNTFEGKIVKLGADIDFNNELQEPIGLMEPIDGSAVVFAGTLDGQNYGIKNLKIDNSQGRSTGLFAVVQRATFKNLRIVSGEVRAGGEKSNYTGVLLGYGYGVTVINCHNEGCKVFNTTRGYTGGLIGILDKTTDGSRYSYVMASTNSAEVSGAYCPSGITSGTYGGYVHLVACANTGKISYIGTELGQSNIWAAGISGTLGGSNHWMYGCFSDCEVVEGQGHSALANDAGSSSSNFHYSYSANTSLSLLTSGGYPYSAGNNTIGYSSYNDAVDNLNKGIQMYNWTATVPCPYKFVKGDKPTLVDAELSTNPGVGNNNFGNGGKF